MARKTKPPIPKDDDFAIYVDPSCLSTPMEDENKTCEQPAEVAKEEEVEEQTLQEDATPVNEPATDFPADDAPAIDASAADEQFETSAQENQTWEDIEKLTAGPVSVEPEATEDACEEASSSEPVEQLVKEHADVDGEDVTAEHESKQTEAEEGVLEPVEPANDEPIAQQVEQSVVDEQVEEEQEHSLHEEQLAEEPTEQTRDEPLKDEQDHKIVEGDAIESTAEVKSPEADEEQPADQVVVEEAPAEDPQHSLVDESPAEQAQEQDEEQQEEQPTAHPEEDHHEEDLQDDRQEVPIDQESSFEDEETPRPTQRLDSPAPDDNEYEDGSRRSSGISDRRTSLRTEALIQAAARAVVAKLEKRKSGEQQSVVDEHEEHIEAGNDSLLSLDEEHSIAAESSISRRESSASQIHHTQSVSGDETAGDSSSHHDADEKDDVFSDRSGSRSGRSSLGSFDAAVRGHGDDLDNKQQHAQVEETTTPPSPTPSSTRTHRLRDTSGISSISGLSRYDHEPGEHEHAFDTVKYSPVRPRVPFRSPSSVRAMQMSSPTLSAYSQTPNKRPSDTTAKASPFPTISRLGSPAYTPKRTPTRLKPARNSAPLVLLHVTLLPLRWSWGHVLDAASSEGAELSEQATELRDAWHALRVKVGDTVLERGVLLAHPQADYEVLEERLLEALELPVRVRARVLECGHYLGASNMPDEEESESEADESADEEREQEVRPKKERKHWCNTCHHEIRFEALGPKSQFRVKVYASNGLMRAGAWEACWKEMERVDVEIEPVMEQGLLAELERLAAQLEQVEEDDEEEEDGRGLVLNNTSTPRDADIPRPSIELDSSPAFHTAMDQTRSPMLSSPPPALPPVTQRLLVRSPGRVRTQPSGEYASPILPPSSIHRPHSSATTRSSDCGSSHEPIDRSEARRRRDAERMREIYGDSSSNQPSSPAENQRDDGNEKEKENDPSLTHFPTPTNLTPSIPALPLPHQQPQLQPSPTSSMRPEAGTVHRALPEEEEEEGVAFRHPDRYIAPPSPRSPSEMAYERKRSRSTASAGQGTRSPYQGASLRDLLMETVRVLMRDPRNVAIAVLGVFVVFMVVRPAPVQMVFDVGGYVNGNAGSGSGKMPAAVEPVESMGGVQKSAVFAAMEPSAAWVESVLSVETSVVSGASSTPSHTPIPAVQDPEPSVEPEPKVPIKTEIQTIAETITQTETITSKLRTTATQTETVRVKVTTTVSEVETETVVETVAETEATMAAAGFEKSGQDATVLESEATSNVLEPMETEETVLPQPEETLVLTQENVADESSEQDGRVHDEI